MLGLSEGGEVLNIEDVAGEPLEFNGELLTIGDYQIPVINYTPEKIFSNRVPAFDINFVSPSVDPGNDRNIAAMIQPTVSSWYQVLRLICIVGLLSVLIYIGIRMLLTSVAADRAKYKSMLMNWIVAMVLVFILHYIMSFALTIAESITSLISSSDPGILTVQIPNGESFNTNIMGYVRFMMQAEELKTKILFLILYIALVTYSVRFTWIYLKRVANMAFLTLIAPLIALTYPIDKVSDGKAQAFDMWIKEFVYNALLQPLHLLIYIVLIGGGAKIAANNPLYAIVCFGFIIAAEKMLKKMFGFDKASGGTLGSLAGAAGVTALASKAIGMVGKVGKGGSRGKGGQGKVRTKDTPSRIQDRTARSGYDAFNTGEGAGLPSPNVESENENGGRQNPQGNADNQNQIPPPVSQSDTETPRHNGDSNTSNQTEGNDFFSKIQEPDVTGSPLPREARQTLFGLGEGEQGFFKTVGGDIKNFGTNTKNKVKQTAKNLTSADYYKGLGTKAIKGVRRNAIGAWKAAPRATGQALRLGAKTAGRAAFAGALGAAAGAAALGIGLTTGDGEKAFGSAIAGLGAGLGAGAAVGGKAFEATAGRVVKQRSVTDKFRSGKYGSAIEARNARADKEYLKSAEFEEYYDHYFKGSGKSKKEVKEAFQDYRSQGITNADDIRRGMALEQKAASDGRRFSRQEAQSIINTRNDIDKRAYYNTTVQGEEINKIANMLTNVPQADRQAMAKRIFAGYDEFRKISL